MSEYIVQVPNEEAEYFIAKFGIENVRMLGFEITGGIVRCRNCRYYTHNTFPRCDLYSVSHEVEPNGFCAWGELNNATAKLHRLDD